MAKDGSQNVRDNNAARVAGPGRICFCPYSPRAGPPILPRTLRKDGIPRSRPSRDLIDRPQISIVAPDFGCTGFWVAQRFSAAVFAFLNRLTNGNEIVSAGHPTPNEARSQSISIVAGTPRRFLFAPRNLPRRDSESRFNFILVCLLLVYYTVYYVPPKSARRGVPQLFRVNTQRHPRCSSLLKWPCRLQLSGVL
jgi:hypothetical protein